MKTVFLSNYLNHHQKPLSDELYRLTGGQYRFVATMPMSEARRKLGYKELEAPYLMTCYGEESPGEEVARIIDEADLVIMGSAPYSYIADRCKAGKLVFKYTERLYRQEPGLLKLLVHHFRFRRQYDRYSNCHLLCASAFTASDFRRIGCFRERAYRWGYFPAVKSIDIDEIMNSHLQAAKCCILWVARFLDWKHPELPILLAESLKKRGMDFQIDMYGIGPEYGRIENLISTKNLNDRVVLHGAAPNEEIMKQMRTHSIFLFTSDRNEGWGAVANEAMGSGCAIVASDAIGSTPFLIEDTRDGLMFKDQDSQDLIDKVCYLINNPAKREAIGREAYKSMREIWSPKNAARNVMRLAESILNGKPNPVQKGPCSSI